jgi:hypothetical protein
VSGGFTASPEGASAILPGGVMVRKAKAHLEIEIPEPSKAEIEALIGLNPRRPLNPRSEEKCRNWHLNYKTRIPYGPQPWFLIEAGTKGVWDGESLVLSGWARLNPSPDETFVTDEHGKVWVEKRLNSGVMRMEHKPYWVHDWDLALLYPSAEACLEAAIEISKRTGIHCSVLSLPHEAYGPSHESGWWVDVHEAQHWVDIAVSRVNRRYQAGIDPTPVSTWIRQGHIPKGTLYPRSGLCFWNMDDIWVFWQSLERGRKRKKEGGKGASS